MRNAAFVSLYEQLNLAAVKKCVSVLEAGSADQNLLTSFKAQFNELKKVSEAPVGSMQWRQLPEVVPVVMHSHALHLLWSLCICLCTKLTHTASVPLLRTANSLAVLQVTEESRDNVKFLTTLERHFKNIANAPLASILDTLPPTMNALRMVWIISRYYSDDMRMGSLFKRIGQEIGDRVESAIDIKARSSGLFIAPILAVMLPYVRVHVMQLTVQA